MADVAPQVQDDFDLKEGSLVEVDIADREENQVGKFFCRVQSPLLVGHMSNGQGPLGICFFQKKLLAAPIGDRNLGT